MKKVFDSYWKKVRNEALLMEQQKDLEKELSTRDESLKRMSNEVNKLNSELEKPELSKEAKDNKAKQRDEKITEFQTLKRDSIEFKNTREKALQEAGGRMRKDIVDEMQKLIDEKVKSEQFDLVLDKSGMSFNGLSIVLHSKPAWDFTDEIITSMNKNKPKDEPAAAAGGSTDKPATDTLKALPAATPKKKQP